MATIGVLCCSPSYHCLQFCLKSLLAVLAVLQLPECTANQQNGLHYSRGDRLQLIAVLCRVSCFVFDLSRSSLKIKLESQPPAVAPCCCCRGLGGTHRSKRTYAYSRTRHTQTT